MRYHAIAIAAAAPELHPVVARASGSFVSLTLYCFSTSGSTSVSTNCAYRPDIVSYSSPRWLPCASPLPLLMEMATITGTRFCAIRCVERLEQQRIGTVSADDERHERARARTACGMYTATRRVYGAGALVVTSSFAGLFGSGVPKVPCSRRMPG